MPRSGYDRTNCEKFYEAQGNHQTAEAPAEASEAGDRATSIPKPIAPPISDPNLTSPSHSPPRTPIVPKSTTVQLSSSPLLSTAVSSTTTPPVPSAVSFQGHPDSIPSPFGSASTSTNPIPSSLSPSSAIPVVKAHRELLPTVRISPGYVEHTGSYRVYNNSTGRGWRYSPPNGKSVNSVSSRVRGQQQPDNTISGYGSSRRRRQGVPQPLTATSGNRGPEVQTGEKGEVYNSSHMQPINKSPPMVDSATIAPRSCAPDSSRREG